MIIGQSNMAGRGFLNEAKEIDGSRIYTLRNGRWQLMFRPINPDRSFSGVNLAESFAEGYAKKHDVDVGLICCADGGTSLDQWKPGDVLFDNAVFQTKLAMRSSELKGILWHQGESDCLEHLSSTYCQRFEEMRDRMRKELGLPNIPFVVGGLGDFLKNCTISPNVRFYERVNAALINIVERDELTVFASAEGLGANPDELHFNAEALHTFGLRYLDAFEKLNVGTDKTENSSVLQDTRRSEIELL